MKRRRALRQAGPTSCYTPRVRLDLDTIRAQHQAAIRFGEQSELHAVLAGKALLQLRRNMGVWEWREWVKKARIPQTAILKYIREAEALEVTALATAHVTRLFV